MFLALSSAGGAFSGKGRICGVGLGTYKSVLSETLRFHLSLF